MDPPLRTGHTSPIDQPDRGRRRFYSTFMSLHTRPPRLLTIYTPAKSLLNVRIVAVQFDVRLNDEETHDVVVA